MTSFSRTFLDDSIKTIAAFDDAEIEGHGRADPQHT